MAEGVGRMSLSLFKFSSICIFVGCASVAALGTIHWPLAGDASIMHYVTFLLDDGKKPYVDIKDINMPGAWLADYLVTHTLGGGSLAWRLFDLLLLGLSTAAMISITRPVSDFAGAFAGLLFALVHIQDGIYELGQRDLIVAVLILLSYAALFRATRHTSTSAMLAFGLLSGLSAMVKPTFIVFGPALFLLLSIRRSCRARSIVVAIAGWLAAPIAILVYLSHLHALGAFLSVVHGITAYHASLARRPLV